jgi:cell division protein FtsL
METLVIVLVAIVIVALSLGLVVAIKKLETLKLYLKQTVQKNKEYENNYKSLQLEFNKELKDYEINVESKTTNINTLKALGVKLMGENESLIKENIELTKNREVLNKRNLQLIDILVDVNNNLLDNIVVYYRDGEVVKENPNIRLSFKGDKYEAVAYNSIYSSPSINVRLKGLSERINNAIKIEE